MSRIYVAGTCDTKAAELAYAIERIRVTGTRAVLVDLSTSGTRSTADFSAHEVAAAHPRGARAVFTGDRGSAVTAMATAFRLWLLAREDVAGVLGLGGSGNTALVTEAMRALPVGVPKLMVSTVASGNVAPYVGPTDIAMLYSVTDVSGLNRISRRILANAAAAIAGMARAEPVETSSERPAIGLSMFGVTTTCVQSVAARLAGRFEPIIFHATGTGGQSMEKLLDSSLLAGLVDVTTTEVADLIVGGVLACTEDRFGAVARARAPYVGSCGALDMVNFAGRETVPARFAGRLFHVHNAHVTLMRTTADECAGIGTWIGTRLDRCTGPLTFLIPGGGISALDVPGAAFHDPQADTALFSAIEAALRPLPNRHIARLPYAINDPPFAAALADAFLALQDT